MTLKEFVQKLDLETIALPDPNREICTAYTADLMSDVMGNAQNMEDFVLVTIQAHPNTVAVCSMLDAAAILICNNRQISQEMIDAAISHNIAIFRTNLNQFESSGQIFQLLQQK